MSFLESKIVFSSRELSMPYIQISDLFLFILFFFLLLRIIQLLNMEKQPYSS